MIDIAIEIEDFTEIKYLPIAYRYYGLDYLVSDKFGNLFILPHCPYKRTIDFKQLKVFQRKISIP